MEISNLDNKLLKVGVFYDGGYFAKVRSLLQILR